MSEMNIKEEPQEVSGEVASIDATPSANERQQPRRNSRSQSRRRRNRSRRSSRSRRKSRQRSRNQAQRDTTDKQPNYHRALNERQSRTATAIHVIISREFITETTTD
jgi:hypothetical protein